MVDTTCPVNNAKLCTCQIQYIVTQIYIAVFVLHVVLHVLVKGRHTRALQALHLQFNSIAMVLNSHTTP